MDQLTRRDFLKLAGLVPLAGPPLANSLVQGARRALATENPQLGSAFRREVDRNTGLEIYSNLNGTPLTEADYATFVREKAKSGEYIRNPAIRTCAFLIGDAAWKQWNSTGIMKGEKVLPYLAGHRDHLNEAIANRTRPTSGINSLRFQPYVVRVDEKFIASKDPNYRQTAYGEAFGRWSWDITGPQAYKPEAFVLTNQNYFNNQTKRYYDNVLYHELIHDLYYNELHLSDFFEGNSPNWKSLLRPNYTIGNLNSLRFWNNTSSFVGMNSGTLMNLEVLENQGVNPVLAEPDELIIRRNCLSANPMYESFSEFMTPTFNDAPSSFTLTGIDPAIPGITIYRTSKIKSYYGSSVDWYLDASAAKVDVPVIAGNAQIPNNFLLTKPTDTNTNSQSLITNAFVVNCGWNQLAFTNHHINFWHHKEQLKQGESRLGKFGRRYPVKVPITDWR